MAVYVSVGRRRRRLFVSIAVALVLGLAVGFLIGITRTRSVADRVASVRNDADDLASRVVAIDIEYRDSLAGGSDSFDQSVLRPLNDIEKRTVHLLDRAPWITSDERRTLLDRLASLEQMARDKTPADRYLQSLNTAASDMRATFGVDAA